MRFGAAGCAALCAAGVAGEALIGGAVTEAELVRILVEAPNILLPKSRAILAEAVARGGLNKLAKRAPQTTGDLLNVALNSIVGSLANTATNWNKKAPASKVPDMAEIASPDFPGARRRKIRYGPYRVPPTTEKSLESQWLGDQGMMTSIQLGAKKPCTTNCVIMKISGSIEYADGTSADTGTGAWFHHAALINIGTTVRDPVCGQKYVEDLFMSGNERSEAIYSFPRSSVKAGYHLLMQDMFMLNAELLNMDANEKWVWMTLTYDILDGEHPEYKDGKVVWMNIGPALCGTTANPFGASNVTKTYQPTARKFEEKSIPWVIPVDGQILGSTGHMHDGALGMDFFHDGKKICTSTSLYSKTAKGVMMGGPGASSNSSAGAMPGGHSHGRRQIMGGNYNNKDIEHIAQQIPCLYEPPVKIRKGEKLWIAANYDYDTHPGMKNDKGEIDQAMGIAGTIIALPYPRQV